MADEQITKRKVTMVNVVVVGLDDDGRDVLQRHVATDYVNPEFLEAYVEDARQRWQSVTVSDEPDAGPGGFHGQTVVPDTLDHPDAGTIREATKGSS